MAGTSIFSGKKALICGAARGIGRAIAIALAKEGTEVYALNRAGSVLETLTAEYPNIHPVCVDLSDWDKTREEIEKLDTVDYLVNNAAATDEGTFLTLKKEDIGKVFDVNINSLINVSQVVSKRMIDRGEGGVIVNISSVAAQRYFPHGFLYGPSKATIESITKSMAAELGPHKIRVNVVSPTVTMTEQMQEVMKSGQVAGMEGLVNKHPLQRVAEMDDVVGAVMYLLGDKASFISGIILPVDGGYLASN